MESPLSAYRTGATVPTLGIVEPNQSAIASFRSAKPSGTLEYLSKFTPETFTQRPHLIYQFIIIEEEISPKLYLGGEEEIDYSTTFIKGEVLIVDSVKLIVAAADGLIGATIRLVNLPDGENEVLTVNTSGTNIISVYNTEKGMLILLGDDSVANYQQVLRTARYNNISVSPDASPRAIEFQVNASRASSAIATTTLNIEFVAPATEIVGTDAPEEIVGTPMPDRIIGGGGRDTITGGAGGNIFVYNQLSEVGDTITDFKFGDKIDITGVLRQIGYTGSNPIADEYISVKTIPNFPHIQFLMLDPDGPAPRGRFRTLAVIEGEHQLTLKDLIF